MAKDDMMPPPGAKPKIAIAIGVGPKKPGAPDDSSMPDDTGGDDAGKMSPEDAGVHRAYQKCADCMNYQGDSGACSKVQGFFDPDDGCKQFKAAGGSDEPDADDNGGPPDGDADDSAPMPPPSMGGGMGQ